MVKVRYLGLSNPRREFEELKAFRNKLIAMSGTYFPYSDDYRVLFDVVDALDRAAERFLGEHAVRDLYASSDGAIHRDR